jgi:hypothetical protein
VYGEEVLGEGQACLHWEWPQSQTVKGFILQVFDCASAAFRKYKQPEDEETVFKGTVTYLE